MVRAGARRLAIAATVMIAPRRHAEACAAHVVVAIAVHATSWALDSGVGTVGGGRRVLRVHSEAQRRAPLPGQRTALARSGD